MEQREGEVDLTGVDVAEHLAGRALAQPDLDPRVRLGEPREQPGNVDRARREQGADGDPAADEAAKLVDLAAGALDLGEDAAGASREQLAGGGRHDASRRALEQLGAELGLEPPDLVRERRLGDVQLLGRAREVAVAGDRLGVAELAHLHRD